MASCSICALPEVLAVNRELLAAEPIGALAKRHNVSRQALMRHKEAHLPPAQVVAQGEAAAVHGSALVAELRGLQLTLSDLLRLARERGDLRGATGVVREASRVVEMVARLEGALQPPPLIQVNLAQSVEYQITIGKVIEALLPHPEARSAVVAALQVH